MTDSLLGMLAAARALHERSEHSPGDCATCSTNDRYQPWPCPTATALGATGRSEWTTPPEAPHGTTCNQIEPNDTAGSWPCMLPTGHRGEHRDRDGDTW